TLEAQLQAIVRERAVLEAGLDACGVERFPSQANFILFRTPRDASGLRAALLERGVAVRVFAKDPRLAGCVRVTVGTPDENAAFLAALREALER
nr:aminotransferase class I/II-fold pyridoxal phosphate-dependent enzyme [Myxococcota bacterium]